MNDTTWVLLACAVCVLVIHAYGALLEASDLAYGDPLRVVLLGGDGVEGELAEGRSRRSGRKTREREDGGGGVEVDGWTLLHLFFYGALAFVFPAQWPLLFLLGATWEAYEYAISVRSEWWYARWQDIATNSVGIVLGLALAWSLRQHHGGAPASSSSSARRRTSRPPVRSRLRLGP